MMDRLAARRRTSAAAMSTQLVLFISVTTIADTVLASSSPANRYRAALLWPGRKGTEACYGTEFLDDDPDLVEQQCKTEAFYHTKMCKSQVGMNIGAWPLRSKTAVWKMKVGEEDTGKNVLVSERDARHQKSSLLQPYSIDVLVEEEEEIRRREWREMRKALLLKHGADTGKNLLETKQFGDLEADLKSKVERLDSAEVQKAFESIAEDEVTRLAAKERELFATRGQIYESGSDQGRQALDSELEKQRNALLDGDATGTGGEAEKNQSQAELQKDKDAEDERLSGRLLPERALLRPFRGASTGEFSVSSPKLHYDLIKHFRFSRTGNETVLELGCAGGVTTRILVRLFKKVICVEKRPHFTRKLIPDYPNLVKVNFDLYQEHWAYHMAAVPVHVVFIDALHDYGAVLFDIKAVLAKIHCCVHTIAFHDFSFPGVMRAIEDSGVVKYYGKRWKHLGWGFPNNWRPNMRIQRTKGSMSKGLEQEDEDEHFTDAMSKAFTKQCPAVSSPAEVGGTETTSARSTSTTKKVIKRPSARGLNLPDKELSVAYAHQIKHNSSSSSSAITPPGTASSSSARIPSGAEVEMPWVSMAQNQQQWASLTAYFPTHPEGLLVELKDKFVAKSVLPPGLAPQIHDIPLDETQASKESDTSVENTVLDSSRSSTMNQIEAVERIFRSRYVCELDDDPNWVHTGEGPKPCTPEARRLQRLLRGADPEPLLLRQEVLYYDRKTIRTLLLRRFLERVVAGLSRGTGTAEEDAEMKRPTPAPLSVLALGPEFEKRADEIDARTLEGMVSQIERRQSESNLELAPNKMLRKVRPFVRNQLRIDLLNHGVFAITDIAWQLNKARFLHQHLYPQLPKAMRSSLPHVFEGGEPSSLLGSYNSSRTTNSNSLLATRG
ncbi:unnamed protein product [Amoebophrya sp. A25]|nr:unnamed protein product [Amoebophrya sp. A25]|eukprot:GSA25T00003060001.1